MKKYLVPLSKRNSSYIAAQNDIWRRRQIADAAAPPVSKGAPFITISRQFGCGAFALAEAIAEKLSGGSGESFPWAVYDQALVQRIAKDHKLSEDLVKGLGEAGRSELEESVLGLLEGFTPELKIYRAMVSTIRALAMHGRVIIVGRGGGILTKNIPGGLHIRIIAPFNWRVDRTMALMKMSREDTAEYVRKMDKERENFIRKYMNADVEAPHHYHLIMNNALMEKDDMVRAAEAAARN